MVHICISYFPSNNKHIAIKRSKYLVLSHVNTLKKYINYTTPSSGFNKDFIEKIIIDSKVSELHEYQKNVSLRFDEMKIQSGETSVCECFHIDLKVITATKLFFVIK